MKNNFFKTKAGALTIAFAVIMVAFFIMLSGLNSGNDTVCMAGFALVILSMLYSPVKVYIIDRINK